MRCLPLLGLLAACGPRPTLAPDADADADTGSETDVDTDTDADSDTDADADTDADSDTDTDTDTSSTAADACAGTAFCEPFDGYSETRLADGQTFGPWRASLESSGATMDLDGAHTVSGDRALHVTIDGGATAGGRLYASDGVPLLASAPTHVYGRLQLYIARNGTSVHWTFFGVDGPAEPSSPVPGPASYLLSSLPDNGVNTYSFVDALSGGDDFQDCWSKGSEPMPTDRWTCVTFELDALARHLEMAVDGGAPIVVVDDTGQGCVSPTPGDALWYGPRIEDLYVGAWSFHDMDAPLELWIDDLVVDTAPVACPPVP